MHAVGRGSSEPSPRKRRDTSSRPAISAARSSGRGARIVTTPSLAGESESLTLRLDGPALLHGASLAGPEEETRPHEADRLADHVARAGARAPPDVGLVAHGHRGIDTDVELRAQRHSV